ncbi:MAG: DUF99 family protein [Methanospirillum sp.]|uniref:endonuclease dU n=1 Tax=Methanospirillum sp. TaxID=45200 RepID=UPI00236AC497|nr:DUF99 family protein [Methanospirillum sp.]MDD1728422.1 DUF99 family protein [Methanospirillum sp.]
MQLQKSGIRVLGIAESCASRQQSHLCGCVMRRDLHIDGFVFGSVTVGGDDATTEILRMIRELDRHDLNLIMISGCVIAWYNIIDPAVIHTHTSLPVICVSYEESEGLEEHIRHHFHGDEERVARYQSLGDRTEIYLPTGYSLFARGWGVTEKELSRACILFTHHGKIPEPLRVARIAARSVMQYQARK